MDLLRFITAGNVDDGKSTLIGRLLYDTGNIKSDVLETVTSDDAVNLAHITDGLRAERTQKITIDVAYKYFTTARRKYIIIDAPGHFQYTKNLVTGASGADVMILLVDACNGITAQTRRHSLVASFLQKKQVVLAINKMDAVEFSEIVFTDICNEYRAIASKLQLSDVTCMPLSALLGDNVIVPSRQMPWYTGPTLMQYLDASAPEQTVDNVFRFAVQYVTTDGHTQYCAGKILSGFVTPGDTVAIYPGGQTAQVHMMTNGNKDCEMAYAGQSVCLFIVSEQTIERGNLIAEIHDRPTIGSIFEAKVCWLDERPLTIDNEYILQINSMETVCRVVEIITKTSVDNFEECEGGDKVEMNEFAIVRIETREAIAYDAFDHIPPTGRGIIIDKETNYTSGALVIQ